MHIKSFEVYSELDYIGGIYFSVANDIDKPRDDILKLLWIELQDSGGESEEQLNLYYSMSKSRFINLSLKLGDLQKKLNGIFNSIRACGIDKESPCKEINLVESIITEDFLNDSQITLLQDEMFEYMVLLEKPNKMALFRWFSDV